MTAEERRRGRLKVFLGAAAGVDVHIIADREGRSDGPQREKP